MGRPANDTPTRFAVTVKGKAYARARWRGRVFHLGPAGTPKADRAWADLLRRVAEDPGGEAALPGDELLVPTLFRRFLESPDAPESPGQRHMIALACQTLTGGGPAGVAGAAGGLDLSDVPAAAVTGKDWKRWRRWLCALPRTRRDGTPHPDGGTRYAAPTVRNLVQAALRAYRWGTSEGLIPPAVAQVAETSAAVASGGARASRKRTAADPADVAAVRPHLLPGPRAAIDLLVLTGGRPSEVLRVNREELHTGGVVDVPGFGRCDLTAAGVWVLVPAKHKTAHKGFGKAVWFTPEAQAVLAPFLAGLAPGEFAFSPAREIAAHHARRTAAAARPVRTREGRLKGGLNFRPHYTYRAFWRAVRDACRKTGVPEWTPYQLRHLAKRQLEEKYGVETARVFLGHSKTSTTDIYGGLSFARVRAVAADSPAPPAAAAPPAAPPLT